MGADLATTNVRGPRKKWPGDESDDVLSFREGDAMLYQSVCE